MVAALEEAGLDVPRQGNHSVTARDQDTGKRWRLKGTLCTSMTSTPNDLTARLQRRLETERQQIEETAARELRRLGESLSAVVSGALRSIEGRYGGGDRTAERPADARLARPLVIDLSLFLGICG